MARRCVVLYLTAEETVTVEVLYGILTMVSVLVTVAKLVLTPPCKRLVVFGAVRIGAVGNIFAVYRSAEVQIRDGVGRRPSGVGTYIDSLIVDED